MPVAAVYVSENLESRAMLSATISAAGDVTILGSATADNITINGATITGAGTVTIDPAFNPSVTPIRNVTILLGGGSDSLRATNIGPITGTVLINGGAGNDSITLGADNGRSNNVIIDGRLTIQTFGGDDNVALLGVVAPNIFIDTSAGSDVVSLIVTTDRTEVFLGGGDDTLIQGLSDFVFMKADGGAGTDSELFLGRNNVTRTTRFTDRGFEFGTNASAGVLNVAVSVNRDRNSTAVQDIDVAQLAGFKRVLTALRAANAATVGAPTAPTIGSIVADPVSLSSGIVKFQSAAQAVGATSTFSVTAVAGPGSGGVLAVTINVTVRYV